MRQFRITDAQGGAAFGVRVVTKANKSEVVGVLDDGTLKIRLTASPTDGQENEALVEFLAELLNCDASQIEIVAGLNASAKLVSVTGITPDQIEDMASQMPSAEE